jgi:hypothetical protein
MQQGHSYSIVTHSSKKEAVGIFAAVAKRERLASQRAALLALLSFPEAAIPWPPPDPVACTGCHAQFWRFEQRSDQALLYAAPCRSHAVSLLSSVQAFRLLQGR